MGVLKMGSHLECAHEDKPDVAKAMSFPKGSTEKNPYGASMVQKKSSLARKKVAWRCARRLPLQ